MRSKRLGLFQVQTIFVWFYLIFKNPVLFINLVTQFSAQKLLGFMCEDFHIRRIKEHKNNLKVNEKYPGSKHFSEIKKDVDF